MGPNARVRVASNLTGPNTREVAGRVQARRRMLSALSGLGGLESAEEQGEVTHADVGVWRFPIGWVRDRCRRHDRLMGRYGGRGKREEVGVVKKWMGTRGGKRE